MWLVLCSDDDVAAQWAWAGLAERHGAPVELVTASSLAYAHRWIHHVSDEGSSVEMTLPDGRNIDSRHVHGVLNRLAGIWNSSTERAVPSDRSYAAQEFYAFCISWLACLPGPVINRPSYGGPGGQWRHDSEWALLAARAGLPTGRLQMPAAPTAPGEWGRGRTHVVVLGNHVFGVREGSPVIEGCRRLAVLSESELLGIDFDVVGDVWCFGAATSRPDLRVGGADLLDAIARRFALTESALR